LEVDEELTKNFKNITSRLGDEICENEGDYYRSRNSSENSQYKIDKRLPNWQPLIYLKEGGFKRMFVNSG
jgi:hypothetical protein